MDRKKLGSSDMELTRIGMGTWAIGGDNWQYGWGTQDKKDSISAITTAIENGINWIDTAPAYGLGEAETIIGEILKDLPVTPYIATKCGLVWNSERKIYPCLTAKSVADEIDASLKRLGVDVIDLYQVHWPMPAPDIEVAWETIAKAVDKGKIRYAGVSNFNLEQLNRIMPIMKPVSLQPPYSMLERWVEDKGVLDFCFNNDIGVIAYSPMQKGLLTGKFNMERYNQLSETDHRKTDVYFKPEVFSLNLALVDKLKIFADKYNVNMANFAVAWVLNHKAVTAAIVGARNKIQAESNAAFGSVEIAADDMNAIDDMLKEHYNNIKDIKKKK